MKTLKRLDGSFIEIDLQEEDLRNHFSNPINYTDVIIDQFNTLNYYQNFISETDKTILDIGANVGLFALHVSSSADKIICIEPTPSHFTLLQKTTKNFVNVKCVHGAVSNQNGTTNFYTSHSNTTTNSLIPRDVRETIQVPTFTIEKIVNDQKLERVDFVKMDIEGSEYIVLDDKTLEYISENIPKILIEFHDVHSNNQVPKYIKLFSDLGFEYNHFHFDSVFFYKKK